VPGSIIALGLAEMLAGVDPSVVPRGQKSKFLLFFITFCFLTFNMQEPDQDQYALLNSVWISKLYNRIVYRDGPWTLKSFAFYVCADSVQDVGANKQLLIASSK
jgi:hypothetical protein